MALFDDVEAVLQHRAPAHLPVFCLTQEFDARYAGLTYREYIQDAESVVEVQRRAVEAFGWDWTWLHLDDTLEFEALGVGVAAGGENVVPCTAQYLDFDRETLRSLKVPDPRSARMPLLLDAAAGLREAFGDEKCVTGRVAAPFSAVTLIFGMQQALLMLMDDPELFGEALKFAEEQAISWGLAQIEAGCHAIWLGDCNASLHLISPEHYEQWALEPCRRITQAFQDAGALVFLHNSEDYLEGLLLQAETGPDVLSMGPGIDIAEAIRALRGRQPLMGNIDPIGMLTEAAASEVAAETGRQVRLMAGGGCIFSSGECVPREARRTNLHAMADTARQIWEIVGPRNAGS
ncbi:MAG: uroporphyrinogen decarboxylase family protein [Armatimonadota bacterium]|nr:uroporphyrinogen decarboxylase family protein [Armatimonadota bacterium]